MTRWLLTFCLVVGAFGAAQAKPLVADLSQYRIEIDSSFNGTRLLLFGSRNDTGDILVAVRGPERLFTVRKKERIAGIWVNRDQERFAHVPTYYAIASSRPIAAMQQTALFAPLRIGLNETLGDAGKNNDDFAQALIRYQQSRGLYSQAPEHVSFMGESLFKLVIPFPDKIPGGDYTADVYLFNDGQLSGMQSIPIHVEKTGFDAFVSDMSDRHSVLYGGFAVLMALGIGWGFNALMRRI